MSAHASGVRIRSLARRPWVWVVAGVILLCLIGLVLRFAPLFSVEHIRVSGNSQISTEDVVQAASVPDGTRLLSAPLDEIASRVESLDAVADARVTRDWPNELKIVVRERRPVGYVELAGAAGLVGSDGSVYREVGRPPDDLPQLPDVAVSEVGDSYRAHLDAGGAAAFEVATALPPTLQRSIATIEAADDRAVLLTSDDGVVVKWGSSSSSATKAEVLALLMRRAGWGTQFTHVDITAPDAPAIE